MDRLPIEHRMKKWPAPDPIRTDQRLSDYVAGLAESVAEYIRGLAEDRTDIYRKTVSRVNHNIGLQASATWNPGNIADGDEVAQEITVTGAALGDFAQASFSLDVQDLQLSADVTEADTVTAVLSNSTGGAIDLDPGTLRVRVRKF